MFEVLVTLCLSLSDGPCRAHLLPGYEAQSEALCAAALTSAPPDLSVFDALLVKDAPHCQPVGAALSMNEVAPGVFVHVGRIEEPDLENRGDVSNLGFVVGQTHVAVIDTGTARWMGEALWRAIRAETSLPVSHVFLTHMHPDHAFGSSIFAEAGARIVGHDGLPRAFADRRANYLQSLALLIGPEALLGTRAAQIDISVKDSLEIDLGGRVLIAWAWPMAHTGTDLTVLDRQTATLFAGDLVFDRHTPALDGRLIGWRTALAELQTMDLERVIPGHGGPALDWPRGADPMARYLSVLEDDTRTAVQAGMRLGDAVEEIAHGERANWELFDAYNARNATVAFTELEWE